MVRLDRRGSGTVSRSHRRGILVRVTPGSRSAAVTRLRTVTLGSLSSLRQSGMITVAGGGQGRQWRVALRRRSVA
jgi:hypothetical protein